MKKFAFVFVMILSSVSGFAEDKLVINKLLLKQTDLTASTLPRMDQNGEACGLVKVLSSDKSMTFEGSIMGEVQYKNGEYWVYIPAGTYQIRIKSNGKEPLMVNFRDYNLKQVDSKTTYELSFLYKEYEKIYMDEYKIISGPRLKKYAISILTLPAGLTIRYISALEYMKNLASVFAKDGDCWGEKRQCTILSYTGDEEAPEYMLIVESTNDEGDAILAVGAGYGGFDEKIYEVINE